MIRRLRFAICGGHVQMADGRLMSIAGTNPVIADYGDNRVRIFTATSSIAIDSSASHIPGWRVLQCTPEQAGDFGPTNAWLGRCRSRLPEGLQDPAQDRLSGEP